MKHLYVHIPFCHHICAYCDFSKVFYDEKWADDYLDALQYEIDDKKINNHFETIYIGGGTPSSLNIHQLKKLLELLKPLSLNVKEYSIEVNPESLDEEKLNLMIDYGINRISIGIQTFHNELLKNIQRYHDATKAKRCIELILSKGINDINIDLMYGLPGQTFKHLKEDLDIIQYYDISHISVYSLILEDHTYLKNIGYKPLDDEQDALWYDYINKTLKDYGYNHYEVSNYYKLKPSFHNLSYWYYRDYEGIGLGSHSLKKNIRYENTRSLKDYLNHHYLLNKEELSYQDRLFEKIMMGMRLLEGIDIECINREFRIDLLHICHDVIAKYIDYKMLLIEDHYLKVTPLGMNYLNTILVDLMEVLV